MGLILGGMKLDANVEGFPPQKKSDNALFGLVLY